MTGEELERWLRGHPSAMALITAIHEVVEVWDDLIDQDEVLCGEEISRAFYLLFVEIPRNEFYRAHFDTLSPLIESAILDWHTANAFEAKKQHLETAFGLRCAGQAITVMCARIIGGFDWARQVNTEIRSVGESYQEYAREIGAK